MNGVKQVFTCQTASGASTSSYIDMGTYGFRNMAILPASAGAQVILFGCDTATGTFLPIFERVNTAPVQHQTMTIATTASGNWVQFDCPAHRYIQFCTTATIANGTTFTIIAQG